MTDEILINQVSDKLSEIGISKGIIIGFINWPICPELIILIQSIWKLEAVYCPLSHRTVPVNFIAKLGIDGPGQLEINEKQIYLRKVGDEISKIDDAGYIVCTSGTTSSMKTVISVPLRILEQNVEDIISAAKLGPMKCLILSPPSFDPFLADLLITLKTRGYFIYSERISYEALVLTEFVTITPSVLMSFTKDQRIELLQRLKVIFVGGEKFPLAFLNDIKFVLDGGINCADVWNIYGVTEVSVWSSMHKVTREDINKMSVPIGKPFSGLSYEIDDGELVICADETRRCLEEKRHYTGDLVKVENGELYIIGRKSFSKIIKVHGKRFHIDEIEEYFEKTYRCDCKVFYDDLNKSLSAVFYVSVSNFTLTDDELSRLLSFYSVQQYENGMPLNFNGKFDRLGTFNSLRMMRNKNKLDEHSVEPNGLYRWKVDMEKCIDASPILGSDGHVYIGSHSGMFVKVNLYNGKIIWKIILLDRIEGSAAILKDFVVVGCYDQKVYFLNNNTGEIVSYFETGDIVKCDIVAHDEFVFVGSYDHNLYILNSAAELVYKTTLNGSIYSKVAIKEGFIAIVSTKGELVLLERQSTSFVKVISRVFDSESFFATPTFYNKLLILFAASGRLIVLDILTNAVIRDVSLCNLVFSSPVIANSCLFIGTYKPALFKICLNTFQLSSIDLDKNVGLLSADLVFHNNQICVTCSKGLILVVSLDLQIVDSLRVSSGETFSAPLIHNDLLFIGSRDNYLYCYDLTLFS